MTQQLEVGDVSRRTQYSRMILMGVSAFVVNTTEFVPVALLSDIAQDFSITPAETGYFDWGTGSPGAGVPPNFFSARWTGLLQATTGGIYQLQTTSDDGVRVWVNGVQLINNWTPHGPTVDTSAGITLVAGERTSIVVEYQEYSGGAVMRLRWRTPGSAAYVPVPASQLYLP